MQNMICDFDARGDGEDSDEEGDEANIHRSDVRAADTGPPALDRDDLGEELTSHPNAAIPGAPPGWLPPQPPTDHVYVPKFDAPTDFSSVDNPGDFDSFSFQAKYSNQKYMGHFTPAGAKIVPPGPDGKRIAGGYEFFYNGWEASEFAKGTYVRGEATTNVGVRSTQTFLPRR